MLLCGDAAPSFAVPLAGAQPRRPRNGNRATADSGWTWSVVQTVETEDVPSIGRLALEPSATASHNARLGPPAIAPTPGVSSCHAAASLVVQGPCGAGVYSPRDTIAIPPSLNQSRPVARPERDGPPQIRNIPPLDQTPLWTQGGASRVASGSSSSRSVATKWDANTRAPAPSSSALAASTGRPVIPSWEVPVVSDDTFCGDVAMPSTRESQNPGTVPGLQS